MTTGKRYAVLVPLLFCLLPAWALADWEGVVKVTVSKNKSEPSREISGTVRMKNEMIRLDTQYPIAMSAIINTKTNQSWSLIHLMKIFMEGDLSKLQGQTPVCGTLDIDECLKKQKFKKTGSEKVLGQKCTVYENEGETKVRLWRPNDLKEVASVKMITTESSGQTIETVISEIKQNVQSESHFKVPDNYRAAKNLKNLLQGF